ncbi:Glutathione S-Transferase Sigma 3 [Hyalella azteca]|uniref:glutathione transferase n=1 Tax=Hyalella azteca TaxID=294128 RepID=A0A6A0H3W8_HYAAZ|nr:Glutathione S-Transferase Sigma 3 [Hyalella azteca]
MAPVLAYWDIRGLAQPIRLLLEYTGTKFEDKYYVCGEAPNYDKSCWFDLPYYIDGSVRLTESGAILRYIARQHDLLGKTEEEKYRTDLLECVLNDFRKTFVSLCYGADFLTFADFIAYEMFDQHLLLAPDCLKQFGNLEAFVTNFRELDAIKAYLPSPRCIKTRLNNRMAKFGSGV